MDHSAHGMSHGGSGTARTSCRRGWDPNTDPETGASTCLWYSDMEATFTDAWVSLRYCSISLTLPVGYAYFY